MHEIGKSRRFLAAAAVLAILGIGIAGAGSALAFGGPGPGAGMNGLVQAIADRFGLDAKEVRAVFDEHRTEMHDQMMADRDEWEADRLAKAVEEGRITQEQADAITAKRAELRAAADDIKDMDSAERNDLMREHMDEMKQWAEDNDIPLSLLQGGPRGGVVGRGPGEGRGHMMGGARRGGLGGPQDN
ncbi:MAG: hypothetical protein ABIJ46_00655 [bacterium]